MFPRNQSPRRRVMHENSELTNHDCFANVFRERGFRKFSTAQIGKLLQEEYPNFSLGSILPNDHAKGNAASCWCVGTPKQKNRSCSRRGGKSSLRHQHTPTHTNASPGQAHSRDLARVIPHGLPFANRTDCESCTTCSARAR